MTAIALDLRGRGLARTNNVVGEIGERLALDVYGGRLLNTSARDIDLVAADGRHMQVKTRALPRGKMRVYDFASVAFDACVCIRFDVSTFELEWAREFTPASLSALVVNRPSGVRLTGARARDNGLDVTASFREAWDRLQSA